jgi:hypothetical protein
VLCFPVFAVYAMAMSSMQSSEVVRYVCAGVCVCWCVCAGVCVSVCVSVCGPWLQTGRHLSLGQTRAAQEAAAAGAGPAAGGATFAAGSLSADDAAFLASTDLETLEVQVGKYADIVEAYGDSTDRDAKVCVCVWVSLHACIPWNPNGLQCV